MRKGEVWSRRDIVVAVLVGGCLFWVVVILPLIAIASGMFGTPFLGVLTDTVRNAVAGDPIAIVLFVLSLPLLSIPWLAWVLIKER